MSENSKSQFLQGALMRNILGPAIKMLVTIAVVIQHYEIPPINVRVNPWP